MSIVIVVVLAVVWVVALIPMVVRRITDHRPISGARSHHRRLWRPGSSSVDSSGSGAASVPGAMIGFSAAAQRLHEERGGELSSPSLASRVTVDPAVTQPFEHVPAASRAPVSPSPGSVTSPATAARRRQVVTLLVGATVVFFLVGMLPAARMLWDMALLTLGCTAAYVALLIHFHRLSVERAQKVMALETRRHVTAELESRRHVVAVGQTQRAAMGGAYATSAYATGRYPAGAYISAGTSYASATGPVLSGSGWSVTGVQSHRVRRR